MLSNCSVHFSTMETQLKASFIAISRAVPTVEAHHCVNGPDTGRNSGGRPIKKIQLFTLLVDEQVHIIVDI